VTIGILALQGDVREHAAALAAIGVETRPVRRPADLAGVTGIVLPGGESTTLSMLLESSGLFEPLASALADGLPALGTCAGLVLLARRVLDGRADQRCFGLLDCTVRRNGYGRQLESFEGTVEVEGSLRELDSAALVGAGDAAATVTTSMPAVFIRAPVVESIGPDVEVLARLGGGAEEVGRPVALRHGPVLATAFHPELTVDRRVHRLLASLAGEKANAPAEVVPTQLR
jgi:5'-phosphate synthase pdxT subunit